MTALSVIGTLPGAPAGTSWREIVGDATGNIYGTASVAGAPPFGGILWRYANGHVSTLYSFTGAGDGGLPVGSLAVDASGNVFGVCQSGGASGNGCAWTVSPGGSLTTLAAFPGGTGPGRPTGGLVLDGSGNLYGLASTGGADGLGCIWQISAGGSLSVLHSFSNKAGSPQEGTPTCGAMAYDAAGTLYGVTDTGGSGNGIVWSCTTGGTFAKLADAPCGFATAGAALSGGWLHVTAGDGSCIVGSTPVASQTLPPAYAFTLSGPPIGPTGLVLPGYGWGPDPSGVISRLTSSGMVEIYAFPQGTKGTPRYLFADGSGAIWGAKDGGSGSDVLWRLTP